MPREVDLLALMAVRIPHVDAVARVEVRVQAQRVGGAVRPALGLADGPIEISRAERVPSHPDPTWMTLDQRPRKGSGTHVLLPVQWCADASDVVVDERVEHGRRDRLAPLMEGPRAVEREVAAQQRRVVARMLLHRRPDKVRRQRDILEVVHPSEVRPSADLFLATFRRMPTANAEGWIESEGSVGKVSVRRVFRYLQVGTGPRRSPSACSEILERRAPRPPRPPPTHGGVVVLLLLLLLLPFLLANAKQLAWWQRCAEALV